MHFNRGERYQIDLYRLPKVGQDFFDGDALGLATAEVRAPCVVAMLILLDHYAYFWGHPSIL